MNAIEILEEFVEVADQARDNAKTRERIKRRWWWKPNQNAKRCVGEDHPEGIVHERSSCCCICDVRRLEARVPMRVIRRWVHNKGETLLYLHKHVSKDGRVVEFQWSHEESEAHTFNDPTEARRMAAVYGGKAVEK